jgi:hypothetical protein
MKRSGSWIDEWELPYETFALTFAAKRAKRRPARGELGGEEYLVSVADTSTAARRRMSPYAVAPSWVRV